MNHYPNEGLENNCAAWASILNGKDRIKMIEYYMENSEKFKE